MRPILGGAAALGLALCCAGGSALGAAPSPAFRLATAIPAPDGRWDYANWDREQRRVLISHGSDVLVIDPERPRDVRAIGAFAGAHAAIAIPGTGRIAVTSGHDDTLRVLDLASGRETARIAVAGDPDAMVITRDGRTAYAIGAKAGAVSVVDLTRNVETARIALKPGLEAAALVSPTLLAVNDEDLGEIELADLSTNKAAGTIAMPGCEGPTGLAYDPASGLAVSACANGKAAVVDIARRKLVRLVPIGAEPDTVIWQASHRRFLVPCGGSGTLSIIGVTGRTTPVLPAVKTQISARTAALDADSGRVYLPAASFLPAAGAKRPQIAPGSFRVLVLAPG